MFQVRFAITFPSLFYFAHGLSTNRPTCGFIIGSFCGRGAGHPRSGSLWSHFASTVRTNSASCGGVGLHACNISCAAPPLQFPSPPLFCRLSVPHDRTNIKCIMQHHRAAFAISGASRSSRRHRLLFFWPGLYCTEFVLSLGSLRSIRPARRHDSRCPRLLGILVDAPGFEVLVLSLIHI